MFLENLSFVLFQDAVDVQILIFVVVIAAALFAVFSLFLGLL